MGTATESRFTLLSAFAVQTEIEELLLRFKRQQGVDVDVNYDLNPTVAKRVVDGEAFDVGMTNPWYVGEMISLGRIAPDVHVPFGRIPLAIGTIGSQPKQIISSHEALRTLLLNSSSIAYTSSGTSGKTFLKALEIMGLHDQLRDRLHPMGAAEPPIAAANGQVQYAIAPLSRIIAASGVLPIATFPPELGLNIDMSMFIHSSTRHAEKAKQLIRFLSDPALDPYLQSHGISRYQL
jgi:molybdate transport system substrate-binding protein